MQANLDNFSECSWYYHQAVTTLPTPTHPATNTLGGSMRDDVLSINDANLRDVCRRTQHISG